MGFFSKKVTYPELAADTQAAKQLNAIEGSLKELIGQISDPLEVIPADGHAYVFIGKPPKRFGMAMIDDGVHSLGAAAKENGIDQIQLLKINEKLREAYLQCQDAPRYTTSVAGRDLVITPSPQLAQEVSEITHSIYT
ncbi:hypothetical protein [Geopsychrobacter electrodiphilus]|uniref:hypothetical protein n=1 Tax=Geopsychrobacter electrodiphilus TaxID=225196 RepID=UPI00036245D4|nr:hypothetical protein [Geopsychrobacter electrodiphilus]